MRANKRRSAVVRSAHALAKRAVRTRVRGERAQSARRADMSARGAQTVGDPQNAGVPGHALTIGDVVLLTISRLSQRSTCTALDDLEVVVPVIDGDVVVCAARRGPREVAGQRDVRSAVPPSRGTAGRRQRRRQPAR